MKFVRLLNINHKAKKIKPANHFNWLFFYGAIIETYCIHYTVNLL